MDRSVLAAGGVITSLVSRSTRDTSAVPTHDELVELLRPISDEYSPKLNDETLGRKWHESLLARFAFAMKLVIDTAGTDISVVDL